MTTLPPDPYLALGLPRDVDQAKIKSAYRKLVLKCHPDKVSDPLMREDKIDEFRKVQQAYEIIGDEDKRARYDAEYTLAGLREEKTRTKLTEAKNYMRKRDNNSDTSKKPIPNRASKHTTMGSSRLSMTSRTRTQRQDTLEGLRGLMNGKRVVALCDTGADDNFIAEDAAKELGVRIEYVWNDDRPSFVMGHGRSIFAIGSITTTWQFDTAVGSVYDVTFHVLKDCIFDIMIGSSFLSRTETMTNHRYRLCRIPKPGRALRTRVVNLCGTPSRRLRGSLKSEECSALPDSGAEPNLLSYAYVQQRDWLLDMYRPPESCQLLQFADGSTETVSGRLRLQWSFVTGWGIAPSYTDDYIDFDVLRGCPFDVILGSDFLDDTDAFEMHQSSFQDVIQEGPSGLNVVIWVTNKKKDKKEHRTDDGKTWTEDQKIRQHAMQEEEVDLELERRAMGEWRSNQGKRREGLLKDELDTEDRSQNLRDKGRPGRGDDRTYNSGRTLYPGSIRQPSPTRWPSSSFYPSGSFDNPSRHRVVPARFPSPVGVRRRPTSPTEMPGRRRVESTSHSQYQPKSPDQDHRDAPRRPIRMTDTPHPSLTGAQGRPRAAQPGLRHSTASVHNPSRLSSGLSVDKLDTGSQNTNQSLTAVSSNLTGSSSSIRSGRPLSYSISSPSPARQDTSIPRDSMKHKQIRTAGPTSEDPIHEENRLSSALSTSSSSEFSESASSHGESNAVSRSSKEPSFDSTRTDSTVDSRITSSTNSTSGTSLEDGESEKPTLRRKANFRSKVYD